MTPEEKERIDYEIEANGKARDKELKEWVIAIWVVLIICFVIKLIL